MRNFLVIIYYTYFVCVILDPFKDDAPLTIDPDTVIPFKPALQFLKPVGWRYKQVINILSIMYHPQFSTRNILNLIWQPLRPSAMPNMLGFLIAKGFYH
ncbi:MAG TPA: hypothetical protein PKO19_11535 [Chitinophagales bacterium]|nr:hypothetical protein [Chitinophagales bacterium]HMZ89740.1 hypothetical protein [Chitinophagales bacterium]HNE47005.1 hypothetical protein [Chitinophagales bacterium]HNK98733.1 hypothetical protein [Chitinophagales bacterium]